MGASHPATVVVLAAGEGTRMRSATPKVLHPLLDVPLLGHVLRAVAAAEPARVVVVVGHGRDSVTDWLATAAPSALPVVQAEQHGTGHATRIALAAVPDGGDTVVVVSGDTPLLTGATVARLVATHHESGASATVLTAVVPDPAGYGRVLRDADGGVVGIVEHRDATTEQLAVTEINSGIYAFDAAALRDSLARLTRDNSQGEEYLTDVVALLRADGRRVGASAVADHREVLGVNDRVQLAEAGAILRARINDGWMRAGVTIVDPATTWIGLDTTLEPDVTLHPATRLYGTTRVERGAVVGPDTTLRDCIVEVGAQVQSTTADSAVIGAGASVGPFTYLRPGTRLGAGARAGSFVEVKNSTVGDGSKVPHLSYVGDAEIGERSNIGAATVFVNYDGTAKHRTVVGDDVRIGSDTMLVAPLTVGDGAYTAAGSVITEDVPPGAMGVGRARQRNIVGWVQRRRAGTRSAEAAARATSPTTGSVAASGEDNGAQPGEGTAGGRGSTEGQQG